MAPPLLIKAEVSTPQAVQAQAVTLSPAGRVSVASEEQQVEVSARTSTSRIFSLPSAVEARAEAGVREAARRSRRRC